MSWFADARALVYLRRLTVSQDRIALALEQIAQVVQDEWNAEHAPRVPKQKVTIGTFDVEEANKRYERDREAMAAGLSKLVGP